MERKRLCADERVALMHLFAAMQAILESKGIEKRAAQIPKVKGLIASAKGMLGSALDKIMDSMPEDQLRSLRRNLGDLRYWLSVTPAAGKNYSEDGLWLSYPTLDELCAATKDHCLMCGKSIEEQRKCKLQKALDELPCSKADENARGCRYYGGVI